MVKNETVAELFSGSNGGGRHPFADSGACCPPPSLTSTLGHSPRVMHITRRSSQSLPRDIGTQRSTGAHSKRRASVLLACVGAYVVSYAILSWRGGYIGHNRGGSDNRDTWFPAYCAEPYTSPMGRTKVRLTALGWLFLPAMLVDQIAIHRTRFDVW